MKNSDKILVLDIETTDLSPKFGIIIEVGISELNLTNGEVNIIFDSVCHESGITESIIKHSWIVNNSTLTVPAVKYSKHLDKYRGPIQRIINDYPLGITAFNNTFDFGFMESRGFVLNNKLPCIMQSAKPVINVETGRTKRPSCQEAYDFFFPDKPYTEIHRGGDDSRIEAMILFELFKRNKFKIEKYENLNSK